MFTSQPCPTCGRELLQWNDFKGLFQCKACDTTITSSRLPPPAGTPAEAQDAPADLEQLPFPVA